MNAYKLFAAGVSVGEGVKRFNGNSALYERLLKKFPCDPNYDAMCTAIASGNVNAAFAAAHALKGVAGSLSLTKLCADLAPLVEELRRGSLDNAAELLAPVALDHQAILKALAQAD